jgi:hypothetical protein
MLRNYTSTIDFFHGIKFAAFKRDDTLNLPQDLTFGVNWLIT